MITRLSFHLFICVAVGASSCGGTLDAGKNVPHGPFPVDERNPVILVNDSSSDNWVGEYTMLLSNNGGQSLVGIVIGASNYWPDLNANVPGWTKMVSAARAAGLQDIPDVTVSAGAPLSRPGDGQIDSTAPNRSAGAQRILDLSRELGSPSRPVTVLVGTQLTDVADAYLVDRSVVDRTVIVAALGSLSLPKVLMTGPNGDLDPWADWIVAHRFKYIQVSAYYDQTVDVTTAELANLPKNPLGDWIAAKQPNILALDVAADQITALAISVPQFAGEIHRMSPDAAAVFGAPQGQGPPLVDDPSGNAFVVTRVAAPLAKSRFWEMLLGQSP